MHRKLMIVDDCVADRFDESVVDPQIFKLDSGVGQWIDVMVRVQGPVVPVMWSLFVRDWEMETGERLLDSQHHEPEYWTEKDTTSNGAFRAVCRRRLYSANFAYRPFIRPSMVWC